MIPPKPLTQPKPFTLNICRHKFFVFLFLVYPRPIKIFQKKSFAFVCVAFVYFVCIIREKNRKTTEPNKIRIKNEIKRKKKVWLSLAEEDNTTYWLVSSCTISCWPHIESIGSTIPCLHFV